MLHNANIYIAIVREVMCFFLYMLKEVRKCSILLKKKQDKKRNVISDNN